MKGNQATKMTNFWDIAQQLEIIFDVLWYLLITVKLLCNVCEYYLD